MAAPAGLGAICTRGPSDLALGSVDPGSLVPIDEEQRRQARLFAETRGAIGDLVAERLRRLPEQQRIPLVDGREILMVHGSPADANREISHDLSDDELLALLDDDPADIIVCGSTHVPFQRAVAEYHIVNVGLGGRCARRTGRTLHRRDAANEQRRHPSGLGQLRGARGFLASGGLGLVRLFGARSEHLDTANVPLVRIETTTRYGPATRASPITGT